MIFLISLAISLGLLFGAQAAARKPSGLGKAGGIGLLGLLFVIPSPFCCVAPAIGLSGLLIALSALACGFIHASPRVFWNCCLTAVIGSHLLVGFYSFSIIRERMELRERYPEESMAERLAYEIRPQDSNAAAEPPVNDRLKELEEEVRPGSSRKPFRQLLLKKLHQGTVADFIQAPGFGIGRTLDPTAEFIDLPKADPIPLPAPGHERPNPDASRVTVAPSQDLDSRDLWDMHREGVTDFVNPAGFGYVVDREHVLGFQSHHFRAMPEFPAVGPATFAVIAAREARRKAGNKETERWRVQSLELVSLLKHTEPVAYVSQHLPRMDELRDAPTRPLKGFEIKALAGLRSGEDIEFESDSDEIRLLGSIRAVKDCTSCHLVKRGDLLGAFSYTLRRQIAK